MKVSWFSFSFSCFLLFNLTVSLSVTTAQTEDTDSPKVPREFPKLDQNYIFVENSSIRENLVHHAVTDTEVVDLLEDDDNLEDSTTTSEEYQQTTKPEPQEEDSAPRSEVEWIEDGENTEDKKFMEENSVTEIESTTLKNEEPSTTEIKTEDISTTTRNRFQTNDMASTIEPSFTNAPLMEAYKDGVPLIDGSVAAILVGVFLVVCVFGYTALILWRKSLETKYGSQEMLVDKDDFYDPDDMRHFSI